MSNVQGRRQNDEGQYESVRSVRAYLVDTTARTLFVVPPIGLWEVFVAQMETGEVMRSRAMAVLVNLFAGRLHGKVREFVGKVTRTTSESSRLRVGFADTMSGTIVGIVTYCPVLYLSGASLEEGLVALPGALLFMTVSGRPYGKFLDWWRTTWKTTPVYRPRVPE